MKEKIIDVINRYCRSTRGQEKDFDDFVYWLKEEFKDETNQS